MNESLLMYNKITSHHVVFFGIFIEKPTRTHAFFAHLFYWSSFFYLY